MTVSLFKMIDEINIIKFKLNIVRDIIKKVERIEIGREFKIIFRKIFNRVFDMCYTMNDEIYFR